jgi:hypothetical protein
MSRAKDIRAGRRVHEGVELDNCLPELTVNSVSAVRAERRWKFVSKHLMSPFEKTCLSSKAAYRLVRLR